MSHNSKYYAKRLKKSTTEGCRTLSSFGFLKPSTNHESSVLLPSQSIILPDLPEPKSSVVVGDHDPSVSLPSPSTKLEPKSSVVIGDDEQAVSLPTSSEFPLASMSEHVESSEMLVATQCILPCVQNSSILFPLTKKQMTLDSKYEINFEWLYFSCSKNGYLCKYCELFGVQHKTRGTLSPFITGTELGDHPIRKLEKHEQTNLHEESSKRYIQIKEKMNDLTLPQLFERQKGAAQSAAETTRNRKYMSILVSTINLVVHSRWSLESVPKLINHMAEAKCADVTEYINSQKQPLMYSSSTSVTEILSAMNLFFEDNLLQRIRSSDFVTLLADESTDEANRNQFAILIRFLDNGSRNIKDHFVGLVNVKRADAATLTDSITNFLLEKRIDVSRVMFVGFDGCNTMSGELNGVQKRFRHVVPHSLYVNCRNHRLALCVKHLMKDFKVLENVDAVLLAIYKMFEYSPQKFAVFKDVQSSYAVRELVMVRAAATRWLSHGVACTRFIDRYVQILDTLDELIERKKEPETIGLRDMITNKNTIAAILALADILIPVNIFCKYLQGASLDFSTVNIKMKELTDTLHILIQRFRASLDTQQDGLYLSKMSTLFEEIDDRTVFTRRPRDHTVFAPRQIVEELAVPMVLKLIQELEDGFNFMSPVLKAFSVLSLKHMPDTIVELTNYGKHDIETLTSHYCAMKEDVYSHHRSQSPPLFNKVKALAEFEGFKYVMFMARNSNPGTDMLVKFLEDDQLRATYPCMYKLVLLSRLIPSSTASVERVFSLMNSLCTSNRNRLTQETLTSLMRLVREGQSHLSTNQITNIIDNFKSMKTREIPL